MRFDRLVMLVLIGMLMFSCSVGHAQCEWRGGVLVCTPQQVQSVEASQIYEEELAADPSIVAIDFISETVTAPVSYHAHTCQHTLTYSAVRERRQPVRRVLRAIVRAPLKLARAGAQQLRQGVARRSGRRAARASSRYHAAGGCR